jgi:hypothetical protein
MSEQPPIPPRVDANQAAKPEGLPEGFIPYKDMSYVQLAKSLGRVQFKNDEVYEAHVTDALLDKLQAEYEPKTPGASAPDPQRAPDLLDRVLARADEEVADLQAASRQPQQPDSSAPDKGAEDQIATEVIKPKTEPKQDKVVTAESKTPERAWDNVEGKVVQYGKTNQDGVVKVGVEFSRLGDVLPWADNDLTSGPGRQILIEDVNGSLVFVKGNTVHYFERESPQDVFKFARTEELTETSYFEDGRIGDPLEIKGENETNDIKLDAVSKVLVKWSVWDESLAAEKAQSKRDEDPFELAENIAKMFETVQRQRQQQATRPLRENRENNDAAEADTQQVQLADRKFNTSQSLLSWSREDRANRKKLLKSRKLGRFVAGALTVVDYFTSVSNPRLSNKYLDVVKDKDPQADSRIKKIAGRLKDVTGRGVERAVRAKNLVQKAGRIAVGKTVDVGGDLRWFTQAYVQAQAEFGKQKASKFKALGRLGLSHMIDAGHALALETQATTSKSSQTEDDL